MPTETGRELFAPSERDRLLAAMAELCLEVGFAEMTIEGLVERAGVSHEKFSELFDDDKGECLVAAVNTIMGETVSVVSGAYSADTSELDSALLGVRAILELMAAQPSYANLGYIVARQSSPRRVGMIYDTGIMVLVVMLERLRDYGESDAEGGQSCPGRRRGGGAPGDQRRPGGGAAAPFARSRLRGDGRLPRSGRRAAIEPAGEGNAERNALGLGGPDRPFVGIRQANGPGWETPRIAPFAGGRAAQGMPGHLPLARGQFADQQGRESLAYAPAIGIAAVESRRQEEG